MKTYVSVFTLLGVMLISFSQQLFSQVVSMKEAQVVAENFLQYTDKDCQYSINDIVPIIKEEKVLLYHVSLSPIGYFIMTTDKNLPPVLAYSFEQNLDGMNDSNLLLRLMITDVQYRWGLCEILPTSIIQAHQIKWHELLSENGYSTPQYFEQWPPEGSTATGGWLETNWTQNAPYNNSCPVDPVTGVRSLVGCPATAMAMVLNYYKNLNETEFTDDDDYYHSYAGRNYWIDDDSHEHDFLSFPDMNQHLNSIQLKYDNNEMLDNSEKAALSFACGVAAHQVYTSQVSGTFGVDQALMAYQRFGFEEAVLYDETFPDFYAVLSQNMMEGRPAHLAVVDPGWTMGHNVVCDGYNTEEFYHLNFGWGGTYNGWYLLPDEIPYGLTVIEGCIMNIAYPPIPSGIHDAFKTNFQLYPIPADDRIFIKNPDQILLDYEILDMTGTQILTGSTYQMVNIQFCSPGIYFIHITYQEQEIVRKFIKH